MADINNHERRALPIGARVLEFEILEVLGGGGFGIVYLANDHSLGRRVAIKEYMPGLALRVAGTKQVIVNFGPDGEAFRAGMRGFVKEARLLARFDHPALVKVFRVWEANGTAYMAMPFYEGPTLQRAVEEKTLDNSEEALLKLLEPLLDALETLHEERCYHRDISPDNILLTPAGPVLLDFGAARTLLGNASQNLTVVLKEGYAPVEQYATDGTTSMRQGPWTDIYALAGVIRFAMLAEKPRPSVARIASRTDVQEPLYRIASERYTQRFLRAIDHGMALYVEERPQSIAHFRALMTGEPLSTAAPSKPATTVKPKKVAATVKPRKPAAAVKPRQPAAVPGSPADWMRAASAALGWPWPREKLAMAAVPLLLLAVVSGTGIYLATREPAVPPVPGGPSAARSTAGSATSPSTSPASPAAPTVALPARAPVPVSSVPAAVSGPVTRPVPAREGVSTAATPELPPHTASGQEGNTGGRTGRRPPSPPRARPPVASARTGSEVSSALESSSASSQVEPVGPPVPERLRPAASADHPSAPIPPASEPELQYTHSVALAVRSSQMNDRPQDTEDYRAALLRHHEEARVSFVLDRKGRVSQVIIVQSSGSKALDQWAIRIIRNGHYAPFPYDVWPGQEGYTFEVPLRFQSTR